MRQARASVTMIVLVVLVMLELLVIGAVLGVTRQQDLTVRRVETIRAFYAAEAGVNMAIRELMANADEDGDGTVGSISDDGNDANNPTIGQASILVTVAESGGTTTVTSLGASGDSVRSIELRLE